MANPSLQIGNSNWAIKEDDLLGYSTVGTNYLPKPMTMTRASAGTRVDENGLVNYVEVIGSEQVTNGDFATDSDWDLGSSWSISGGKANYDAVTNASELRQLMSSIAVGTTVKIQFDILDVEAGKDAFFKLEIDGTPEAVFTYTKFSAGTYTYYHTIATAFDRLTFFPLNTSTGGAFSIDNVSVKESTKNNLARVDYTDGTSSLLAEPQRTNNIEYSEDFTQSYWRKDKVTVTANSIISPSGQLDASLIQETVYTGGVPSFDLDGSITLGTGSHTFTFYVKNNNGRYLGISFGSSGERVRTNFDFTTNTFKTLIFNGTTTGSASFTTLGDYYRISITATFPSSTVADTVLMPLATDTYPFYAFQDSDNRSFYLWGAQLEEATYATSYIPTDGTTVTRVQDQYEKTGISNLINSEEGSFFVDIAALNTSPGSQISISLSGNGSNNRVLIYTGSGGGKWITQFRKDAIVIVTVEKNTTITNQSKLAVSWKSGKYLMYIDGDKATTYNTGSETESDTFDAGDLKNLQLSPYYNSSSNLFFGKVKQLQVFKTALTDPELETLTTI